MKKSVFMLMAAAALVSCSDDNNNAPLLGDDVIRLNSTTLTAGTATRTPFTGGITSSNPLKALVPSTTVQGDYTTQDNVHTATGTMTFDGSGAVGYNVQTLEDSNLASFPQGIETDAPLYLFGLYPADNWEIAAAGTTATFTGCQDIMAAQETSFTKGELKNAANGEGDYASLAFGHLLTKLEVQFKASETGLGKYGRIQKIELMSDESGTETAALSTKVTYDPTLGDATFSAEDVIATMNFYNASSSGYTDVAYNKNYEPTKTATLQAYCLTAPVTATGSSIEYFIKVTTQKEPAKIFKINLKKTDGTDFTGSTAGHSFNIIINYTVDDINVTATVEDWVQDGDTIISAE